MPLFNAAIVVASPRPERKKIMDELEKQLDELFEELVPFTGKAPTVAGELVRAVSHIGYRFYNDGDQLGEGYGNETCNPAGRYLQQNFEGPIKGIINDMWNVCFEPYYEHGLKLLVMATLDYIEKHPESKHTENNDDMYNYAIPEDKNYMDDEDENEYDW